MKISCVEIWNKTASTPYRRFYLPSRRKFELYLNVIFVQTTPISQAEASKYSVGFGCRGSVYRRDREGNQIPTPKLPWQNYNFVRLKCVPSLPLARVCDLCVCLCNTYGNYDSDNVRSDVKQYNNALQRFPRLPIIAFTGCV